MGGSECGKELTCQHAHVQPLKIYVGTNVGKKYRVNMHIYASAYHLKEQYAPNQRLHHELHTVT